MNVDKFKYVHISGEKHHKYAISFCLFKSDKFDYNKHIVPFEQFLQEGGEPEYDILLFYKNDNDLTDCIKHHKHIRLYKVISDEINYERHLWRYLGALENYEWVWFRGIDTPRPPKREINLQHAAEFSGCDLVIWSRVGFDCMGKFCIRNRLTQELITFIRDFNVTKELSENWNCDEKILSIWVSIGKQKILLALDEPTIKNPHQEDWVVRRLRTGNHTVVVKDRDDRIF